ncbi:MAG: helix-turn-helix domain-containing protein [Dysosmobacter welbionis]
MPDLMRVLGIGRNSAYDLVHSNQIRVIRVGRQIRIPRDEVIHFLSRAT